MKNNIVNIPYSQLTISPDNVRVVSPAKASDKQLIASMEARGVLQNLVVNPTDKPKQYEVIAGGRRYAAAGYLIEKGLWDKDVELPCRINHDDDTTAVSLSENLHEPMHPADEFMAYQAMADKGFSEKQIAQEFGVSSTHVKKRLRLAEVAPKIIQDYRKGKVTIEEVMAFTVESDQDKQLECYRELGDHVSPYRIRQYLIQESVTSDSALCRFVGLAAYKKAGGQTSADLFQDTTYLHDIALLEELAMEKLKKAAVEVEQEGWASVDYTLEGYSAGSSYFRATPTLVGVPESLEQQIAELEAAMANLEEDDEDWDDSKYEQFEQLENQLEQCELKKESYQQYTEAQKEHGKAIVTIDHNGELLVMRGLQSKSSKRQVEKLEREQAGDEPMRASEFSNSLLSDLGLYRQQIVQAALSTDAKLATDLLHFSLCKQVLADRGYYDSAISLRAELHEANTTLNDLDDTDAGKKLVSQKAKLDTQWLGLDDEAECFSAFRALPAKAKGSLVAYCVARLFGIDLYDTERHPVGELVADTLDINYAEYWRPTDENYFKRLKISDLLNQGEEWFGDQWVEEHAKDKKKDLVALFHDFFNSGNDTGLSEQLASIKDNWVPKGFKE